MKLQNQIKALTPANEHHYVWPSEKAAYRAGAAEIQSAAAAVATNYQANEYQALESQVLKLRADYLTLQIAKHSVTPLTNAAHDVLAERQRQVNVKDWTPEHDDHHPSGEIAAFAAVYAMPPEARGWPAEETGYGPTFGIALCPQDWQPKFGDRRRELVKAGALILAELERMDRAEKKGGA